MIMNTNKFSTENKLFTELSPNPEENIVFSPASILSLLNLLKIGSKGLTYGELSTLEGIDRILTTKDFKDSELALNNFILHAIGVQMRNSYLDNIAPLFDQTSIRSINFSAPKAHETVNEIVKIATNGHITNVISKFPPYTALFLLNTIYFNMEWQKPFEKEAIKQVSFYAFGAEFPVNMMSGIAEQYVETSNYVGFLKNYKNNNFVFVGMLPKDNANIKIPKNFEFQNMLLLQEQRSVEIEIPKFEAETKVDLRPALENMGIKTIFTSNADFSVMTNSKVSLAEIKHQVKLIVSDKGSEGAASTSTMMKTASIKRKPLPKLVFNRPFYYMIVDRNTSQVLFMGRYRGNLKS